MLVITALIASLAIPALCVHMCSTLQDAKRAVAVALRNRWRRHMLPNDLAEEVGLPQGCGFSVQLLLQHQGAVA